MLNFENFFTARRRALNSLYRSIDDIFPEDITPIQYRVFTTSMAATLAVGAYLAFAPRENPAFALANSAAYSEREELCIGIVDPSAPITGIRLQCSPSFHKGRLPNGKLIIDRLPNAHTKLAIAQWGNIAVPEPGDSLGISDLEVDLSIQKDVPEDLWDITSQQATLLQGIVPFPVQAPDELRQIRFESAQLEQAVATRKVQAKAKAKAKASGKKKKKELPVSQRCKSRSYWSVKHNECRRR